MGREIGVQVTDSNQTKFTLPSAISEAMQVKDKSKALITIIDANTIQVKFIRDDKECVEEKAQLKYEKSQDLRDEDMGFIP